MHILNFIKSKWTIFQITQLKSVQEEQEYISNGVDYVNWKIIIEILSLFGLSF